MEKYLADYCVGCGLCVAMNKANIEEDENGFFHPIEGNSDWLNKVCPAGGQQIQGKRKIWGEQCGVFLGWSQDSRVRKESSTGGVLTEIASYLIDTSWVDAIIQVKKSNVGPYQTVVTFCETKAEIEACSGSRYCISHPLEVLKDIDKTKRYALIGKPCDIMVFKNMLKLEPEWEEQIPITLSFFCMGVPSNKAQIKLLDTLGIAEEDCMSLNYRGNGWPGWATAQDKAGKKYTLDYQTSWGKILGRDLMPMCKYCSDGIGEYADIACADAWKQKEDGTPDFSEGDGQNIIFARSERGRDILLRMKEQNRITLIEKGDYEPYLKLIQKSQYNRRTELKYRLIGLKLCNKETPRYNTKGLGRKEMSILTKAKIILGTYRRVKKAKQERTDEK